MLQPLRLFLQLALLFGIAIGCSTDDQDTSPQPGDNGITIQMAKKYYDDNLDDGKKRDFTRSVFWDLAKITKIYDGQEVVAIPLTHLSQSEKLTIRQLWIYKTTTGTLKSMVIEHIREDPHAPTLDNFSGFMIGRDWDNNYILGLTYKSGLVTGVIKDLTSKELEIDTKTAKTNGYSYCGNGTKCIPVRGSAPSVIPDAFWSWSCYSVFDCVWIQETNMGSPTTDMVSSYSFSTGGSTNSPGGPDLMAFKFDVQQSKCSGVNTLLSRADSKSMEHAGVITKTGKLIILPTIGNTMTSANVGPQIWDLNGKLLTDIHTDTLGKPVIRLYDYTQNASNPHIETHQIDGIIHTHPSGPTYNTEQPSFTDKNMAAQFPNINHYVKHSMGIFKYNSNGVTNLYSVLPGCVNQNRTAIALVDDL